MENLIKQLSDKVVSSDKEITRRLRIIDMHERKITKIREKSWWGDIIIRPIMKVLKEKYPDLLWDDERLVPLGLRNAVSVFASNKNKETVVALTFTPTNLDEGKISLDVGYKGLSSNSISDLNGFNRQTEVIEDIQQIFDYIDKVLVESK